MRALIVEDGFQRGSLAACRALGRAGWEVGIGSQQKGFAALSSFAAAWHRVPPPGEDERSFVTGVADAVEAGGYEVVFAAGDGEVLALSAARDRLGAIFPYGPHEDVVRAFDKTALAEAGKRAGLAVPPDAQAEDAPVVVKPTRTTVHAPEDGPLRLRAQVAETPDEARAQIAYLESVGAEPVVQELVRGDLVAQIVVTDRESRTVASVQQRSSAILPRLTGGTVRARTEAVDPDLAERISALLADLNWFGLAQLQFQAPPNGEPVLIDMNGRFYGSLALALAAGPNLPAIWGALALGQPLPPVAEARTGVRYQWLEAEVRRGFREPSVLPGALRYALSSGHGLWDRADRGPALGHLRRLAGRALRRANPANRS